MQRLQISDYLLQQLGIVLLLHTDSVFMMLLLPNVGIKHKCTFPWAISSLDVRCWCDVFAPRLIRLLWGCIGVVSKLSEKKSMQQSISHACYVAGGGVGSNVVYYEFKCCWCHWKPHT